MSTGASAPAETTDVEILGAHLVGSVNLPDAAAVFRAAAERLGGQLRRIPDGEVGERFYWIQFQTFRFEGTPGLARVGDQPIKVRDTFDQRPFALDGTVPAEELVFPDLGYAAAALESYREFARLREEGAIPAETRFQVSLPTPAAVVGAFIAPQDRAAVEPVYERALFAQLDRILDGIPHGDLAVQWDTAVEFALIESVSIRIHSLTAWFDDVLGGVVERAVRQASRVPEDVQLGYHLCYGDVEEQHFVQPQDAGNLAAFLRGLLAAAPRRIDFVHLPVPIERDDAAYFAPLRDVPVPEGTDLYLGLVHHEDGVAGAERRIAAARSVLPRFGIATECGFGRGPAERTAPLLDLHREIAEAHQR
ncbi:hypothetical protein [Naasia aerilata]|uniref:Methionine synthase II (Cobalamin-independent) n=1 Tax=Naasia aerilata TaxID=1162966 RepID=A0ABM8GFW0_9MICO|nr:hypothetical protein [Naasia aerilata]BDZ47227.1 hypothetical protein GCM10025866_31360 [Naasia aerilata]